MHRLLVTASVVPSSPILVTMMKEALRFPQTSVLTRAPRRYIPEDANLLSEFAYRIVILFRQYTGTSPPISTATACQLGTVTGFGMRFARYFSRFRNKSEYSGTSNHPFRRVSWERKMGAGACIKWTNKINLFRDRRNWKIDPENRYIRKWAIEVSLYCLHVSFLRNVFR
jgi:hypothetical protein